MSYVRKKTIHPSAMGGMDEAEYRYGGKYQKKSASKKRSKSKGFCIKAPSPGINKTHAPRNKGHNF